MVTDTNDGEMVEVVLRIRKCDNRNCRRDAITLEGPGADCPTCHNGELLYSTGDVQTVEMTEEGAEKVADTEIMEIKD